MRAGCGGLNCELRLVFEADCLVDAAVRFSVLEQGSRVRACADYSWLLR